MKRAFWWLATGSLAVAAVFAQLDRASARQPALALAVPGLFRSVAQVPVTALALTEANPEEAREEARRLVHRRPIPAEHVFLLALAELRAGRAEAFAEAFELSTQRGWRARAVQVAAARAALDASDVEGAANRIAALWALGADNETKLLTDELLDQPGGRGAFRKRAEASHVWEGAGMRQLDQADQKRRESTPSPPAS